MEEPKNQPTPTEPVTNTQEDESPPPLSAADYELYNHMADHMNMFHERFRQTWTMLWQAATTGQRAPNMRLTEFLDHGILFTDHIKSHHHIEETYIFPVLAEKMDTFDREKNSALIAQHDQIHAGLKGMESYLRRCRSGEIELQMSALRETMESFGGVLWEHLDDEVRTLGAANMRKYWSREQMKNMPM